MMNRGHSPHVDWTDLDPDELRLAEFPIYIHEQVPGDLVVFPPATAHQVWNTSSLTTKLVWNILHPLCLEVGFDYVLPAYNRLCHPDIARTTLSLACAVLSLAREDDSLRLPPDLRVLAEQFKLMVDDEIIIGDPTTEIICLNLPTSVIATCNFCGTAIWNRHVRCNDCNDFDLCLACFGNGRGCEHTSGYSWAELVPQETCNRALNRAREILGPRVDDHQK